MRVEDADLLDEFLEEQSVYSVDFQALILHMVNHQLGNVEWVYQQIGVPMGRLIFTISKGY